MVYFTIMFNLISKLPFGRNCEQRDFILHKPKPLLTKFDAKFMELIFSSVHTKLQSMFHDVGTCVSY